MAVLGYDVEKVYEGRGVLEAASMGVDVQPGDLALRCNLLTVENGILLNHSAGHITNGEALVLMKYTFLFTGVFDLFPHCCRNVSKLLVIGK